MNTADRLSEILAAMREAATNDEVVAIFSNEMAQLGFKHHAYAFVPRAIEDTIEYISRNDLPSEWMQHYLAQKFYENDYLIDHCQRHSTELYWDDVLSDVDNGRLAPQFLPSMHEALDFGLLRGLTIPIATRAGYDAGISLFRDKAEDVSECRAVYQDQQNLVRGCVDALHMFLDRRPLARKHFELNSNEVEVLRWSFSGLQEDRIAEKIKRSRKTVEARMRTIRRKLGAKTTTQAVAKAAMLGIVP